MDENSGARHFFTAPGADEKTSRVHPTFHRFSAECVAAVDANMDVNKRSGRICQLRFHGHLSHDLPHANNNISVADIDTQLAFVSRAKQDV
jgi:hypothetical protein